MKTIDRKLHFVVLGLYAVLAVALSYPVLVHPATHVPGSNTWAFDEYSFLWNIWYFKHSLIDLHSNPFFTNLLYYPLGTKLILHTYAILNDAMAVPLTSVFPIPLASNLLLWLADVLSAYGTFLLALLLLPRSLPRGTRTLAAIVGGIVYAFASNRAIYSAIGHYNLVSTAWIPFFALYLVLFLRNPKLKSAILLGVFFAAAALTEMIYATFLVMFAVVLLLAAFTRPRYRGKVLDWAKGFLVASAVGIFLWLPVLVPILRELLGGGYGLHGWGDSLKLSVDLLGFVTPTALHPIWGRAWEPTLRSVIEGRGRFADINTVFLGYATVLLTVLGAWKFYRKVKGWMWVTVLFWLLCFGPVVQVHGKYVFDADGLKITFPMPYLALHYVPFFKDNRAPNRYSLVMMLGMAVLVSYGVAWLLSKLRRPGHRSALALVLGAAIIFEHLAIPLPTTNATVPAVYRNIAADQGDFSIMQFPLGWRDGFGTFGAERTQAQFYQSLHHRPILGGFVAREPRFKMAYFRRIPLFQAIAEVESGRIPPQKLTETAKAQAPDLLNLYAVRYIVFLPPIPGRQPYSITWERTRAYARKILALPATPSWKGDGIEVYRIQQEPVSEKTVEFGEDATYPYRGEGWADNESIYGKHANWATSTKAVAFLPPLTHEDHVISIDAHPFAYPGAPPQTIRLLVNGRPIGNGQQMSPDWKTYTWRVPASFWKDTTNRLEFLFGWKARPRDVLPANTRIGQTGVELPVDVYLEAAPDHAYIAIFDEKGRKTDGTSNADGYNFAVLGRKGRLLEKRWFRPGDNHGMAQFIESLPKGAIVLAATRGSAANRLDAEGIRALRMLGSGITEEKIRGGVGVTHALAGIKGAAPGTAAEVFSATTAYLHIGKNPDRRTLAAAVSRLRVETAH